MAEWTSEDRSVSVKIDSNTKKRAEEMLEEMGLDMTAYIAASVRALVREKRIPFSMVTQEYHDEYKIEIISEKPAEKPPEE